MDELTRVEQLLSQAAEQLLLLDVSNAAELDQLQQCLLAAAAGAVPPVLAAALEDALQLFDQLQNAPDQPQQQILLPAFDALLGHLLEMCAAAASAAPADIDTDIDAGDNDGAVLSLSADELQLRQEFVERHSDFPEEAATMLLDWEQTRSRDALAALRRLVHSLKGDAGFIGANAVGAACHYFEDLLDQAEAGSAQIDALLSGCDCIGDSLLALINIARPAPAATTAPLAAAPAITTKTAPAEPGPSQLQLPPEADPELAGEFVTESLEHLNAAEALLIELEKTPADADKLNAVFRCFHTIKGVAGFLGLRREEDLAHIAEDLLDSLRKGSRHLDMALAQLLLEAVDAMTQLVQGIANALKGGSLAAMPNLPTLRQRLAEQAAGAVPATAPATTATAAPPRVRDITGGEAAAAAVAAATAAVNPTMRVKVSQIDDLANMVGELVITCNMLQHNDELQAALSREDLAMMAQLQRITRRVQKQVSTLRMVPIRPVFQRMHRVVRDVGQKTGKQLEFVTEGEDLEIDKNLVDRVADPLIHLIRNAVDHGLETPEQRRSAGKGTKGRIGLRAYQKDGYMNIEVSDDGRGLNRDRIIAKAIERNLLHDADSDKLADEEVWSFIFHPGFSTAAEVTDVSGRGVGMDVVKRLIDEMRGQVRVQSTAGAGTTVCMSLPLTLAVIDGLIVESNQQQYVVPAFSVLSSIQLRAENLSSVYNRAQMLQYQDRQLCLYPLASLLDSSTPVELGARAVAVIVADGHQQMALAVDALVGRQQVVLKAIGRGLPGEMPGIGGASIGSDGRVVLVLDVPGLLRLVRRHDTETDG